MRSTVDQVKRQPGRPRSARADEAILGTVIELLGEGTSLAALSIEAVAARAGVGKATIYRRWASKDALVAAAAVLLKPQQPQPLGQCLRDDLVMLLRAAGSVSQNPAYGVFAALMPQFVQGGEFYDLYQGVIEPSRDVLRGVLRQGVESGELRGDLDVEVTMSAMIAPMVLQRLMTWNPKLDEDSLADRLVDAVLEGARVA